MIIRLGLASYLLFFTVGLFPFCGDEFPLSLLIARVLSALFIFFPIAARWGALGCLITSVVLLWVNPFSETPEFAYVNWILLAWALGGSQENVLGPEVRRVGWFVAGVSYFYTGWVKVHSAAWLSGEAMDQIVNTSGVLRGVWEPIAPLIPSAAWRVLTYSTLSLTLTAWLGFLIPFLRKFCWLGLSLWHLGVLIFFNLTEVSLGMLLFQGFIYDPDWFGEFRERCRMNFQAVCCFSRK